MAKGHKAELESVEFRPAKGGVISTTRTKFHRGGSGGGPDYDYEHETAVHPTMKHAIGHLTNILGPHFGEGVDEAAGSAKELAPKGESE